MRQKEEREIERSETERGERDRERLIKREGRKRRVKDRGENEILKHREK